MGDPQNSFFALHALLTQVEGLEHSIPGFDRNRPLEIYKVQNKYDDLVVEHDHKKTKLSKAYIQFDKKKPLAIM